MFLSNQFKKYCTYGFFFVTLFAIALQAQEQDENLDPINKEFSGALSVIPEIVSVGDGGNLADPITGLGAVQEPFQMAKYDTTTFQWSVFLSSVHVIQGNLEDPRHLYHEEILDEIDVSHQPHEELVPQKNAPLLCALSDVVHQTVVENRDMNINWKKNTIFVPKAWGTPRGHYYGSLPMTRISINDSKRYCNWLHHGAPYFDDLSDEHLAITETGAYDFTNGKQGELTPEARYFIPSLNQWYKAAYYQAFRPHPGYWLYPTQGNELPRQNPIWNMYLKGSPQEKTGANYATTSPNWPYLKFYYLDRGEPLTTLTTPVGFFSDSPGAYGTYDMGGNVRQWTSDFINFDDILDSKITKTSVKFIAPGGSYDETSDNLKSDCLKSNQISKQAFNPLGSPTIGLRVAALANVPNKIPTDIIIGDSLINKNESGDHLESHLAYNVFMAQMSSYAIEAMMNAANLCLNNGEVTLWKIVEPFTLQRNVTNILLSSIIVSGANGEAHHVHLNAANWWNIGYLVISIAIPMVALEIQGGLIMESAIGELLKPIAEYCEKAFFMKIEIAETKKGWTLARVLMNVYYIGLNTYTTTKSDLKYFNEQQKQQR